MDKFLPLQETEIADVRVAQRMINYVNLIEDVVSSVKGADTTGLKQAHRLHSTGRFFAVMGRQAWLGIDRGAWRIGSRTPMWIRFQWTHEWGHVFNDLKATFPDGHRNDAGWFMVPVPLTAGVERDTVVEDAARHVEKVFKKLDDLVQATTEPEVDEGETG